MFFGDWILIPLTHIRTFQITLNSTKSHSIPMVSSFHLRALVRWGNPQSAHLLGEAKGCADGGMILGGYNDMYINGYDTVDGRNIQTPSIRYNPLTPKVQCYCSLKCVSPNGRK